MVPCLAVTLCWLTTANSVLWAQIRGYWPRNPGSVSLYVILHFVVDVVPSPWALVLGKYAAGHNFRYFFSIFYFYCLQETS